MRRILIPSDLSEPSERALAPAIALAERLDASAVLLHVVEALAAAPHGAPLAPPVDPPRVSERIESARQHLAERVARLAAPVPVECDVVSASNAADGILRFARQNEIDMIAMATHGRTGVRHLVLGSVAEAVLRRGHLPVLCYPPPES